MWLLLSLCTTVEIMSLQNQMCVTIFCITIKIHTVFCGLIFCQLKSNSWEQSASLKPEYHLNMRKPVWPVLVCKCFPGPRKGTKFPEPRRQGITPQNMSSSSTPRLLARQPSKAKATSPNTWQTNAVSPYKLIASLRCPQLYLWRSFKSKSRSSCPSVRLKRCPAGIWMLW